MDEGQWSDWDTFHRYADRFDSLFGSSSGRPQLHVLAGNHDLGFHYAFVHSVVLRTFVFQDKRLVTVDKSSNVSRTR